MDTVTTPDRETIRPDVARPPVSAVVFGRRFRLPRTRLRRQVLGWSFVAGGMFSFLPILGAWMFPVGFVILSVDSARMRRSRRRLTITIGRRWPRVNAALRPAKS